MSWYKWLWSRIGGRPWTYIIRDTWATYEGLWIIGLVMIGAALGHYLGVLPVVIGLAIFGVGYSFGHLFWGTSYIPGQKGN